jgi:hypothetical protein
MNENREPKKEESGLNGVPPELLETGKFVRRLPLLPVPDDLADRTLARVYADASPAQARRWWLRPITHPWARAAAAGILLAVVVALSNVNTGERVGRFFERLMGPSTTEHLEQFVDRVLNTIGPKNVRVDMETLVNQTPGPRTAPTGSPSGSLSPREHDLLSA